MSATVTAVLKCAKPYPTPATRVWWCHERACLRKRGGVYEARRRGGAVLIGGYRCRRLLALPMEDYWPFYHECGRVEVARLGYACGLSEVALVISCTHGPGTSAIKHGRRPRATNHSSVLLSPTPGWRTIVSPPALAHVFAISLSFTVHTVFRTFRDTIHHVSRRGKVGNRPSRRHSMLTSNTIHDPMTMMLWIKLEAQEIIRCLRTGT